MIRIDTEPQSIPFLKWAGGKRWLTGKIETILPNVYNRYIEPFLGSGAIFFHLRPKSALLADLNSDLVDTYLAIKNDWASVAKHLSTHHRRHTTDYYYQVRSSKPRTPHTRAAQFIYLNRTCWNGLYRVNLEGKFNVPIGTKQNVVLETDDFEAVAKLLTEVEIRCSDFEAVIDDAGDGDLVFADPPYTVHHNFNGFVKYNEKIFRWEDQIRLRNAALRASARGAKVVITNANHSSIHDLYKAGFECIPLSRKSVIAGAASARKSYEELLIISN